MVRVSVLVENNAIDGNLLSEQGLSLFIEVKSKVIGEYLKKRSLTVYTGHCTGDRAFHRLKGILGAQLYPLDAGSTFEIRQS